MVPRPPQPQLPPRPLHFDIIVAVAACCRRRRRRRLSVERGWVRRRWPGVLLVLLHVVLWVAVLLVAVLRQRHLLLLAADAELLSPMRAARRDADCFGAVMVMTRSARLRTRRAARS